MCHQIAYSRGTELVDIWIGHAGHCFAITPGSRWLSLVEQTRKLTLTSGINEQNGTSPNSLQGNSHVLDWKLNRKRWYFTIMKIILQIKNKIITWPKLFCGALVIPYMVEILMGLGETWIGNKVIYPCDPSTPETNNNRMRKPKYYHITDSLKRKCRYVQKISTFLSL
jgi:hypothetical protein